MNLFFLYNVFTPIFFFCLVGVCLVISLHFSHSYRLSYKVVSHVALSSSAAACFMSLNLDLLIYISVSYFFTPVSISGIFFFFFYIVFIFLYLSYSPVLKHLCFTFYTRLTFFALLLFVFTSDPSFSHNCHCVPFNFFTPVSLSSTGMVSLMSSYLSPSTALLCCFIISLHPSSSPDQL